MNFLPTLLFSLLLLLVAAMMMGAHLRARHRAELEDLSPEDRDFCRRQYRRRMQTSSMLGVLAVGLIVGHWIEYPILPLMIVVIYWGGVAVVVLWISLLALTDIWATHYHFGRVQTSYTIERAKLEAELRRIKTTEGNGESKSHTPPAKD